MPTTAAAYKRYLEKFDQQETQIEQYQATIKSLQTQEHAKRKANLERQMRSEFKCLQCKRVFMGTRVRVQVRDVGGTKAEVLVCPPFGLSTAAVYREVALR